MIRDFVFDIEILYRLYQVLDTLSFLYIVNSWYDMDQEFIIKTRSNTVLTCQNVNVVQ